MSDQTDGEPLAQSTVPNETATVPTTIATTTSPLPSIETPTLVVPALISSAGDTATERFIEFFIATIRNPNTRRAYHRAAMRFFAWCDQIGIDRFDALRPLHVATYVEALTQSHGRATVKLHLAALRRLLDWLVAGGILPINPATSVKGPALSIKRGKTAVLTAAEVRQLLDGIPLTRTNKRGQVEPEAAGLRDRALIALMTFTFARVGAALALKASDVERRNHRLWVRLLEKGGKVHDVPCHHTLDEYLTAYLEITGLGRRPATPLFPSIDRVTKKLSATPLTDGNAREMINRRAKAAGITAKISNHTFRASGITNYLENGGVLEKAAAMAAHASTRTTQLYDRRNDQPTLDEFERIRI
ncbi:MAG: tyrosine-type recombinase/integrase [Geminicoccaceae bacterium]